MVPCFIEFQLFTDISQSVESLNVKLLGLSKINSSIIELKLLVRLIFHLLAHMNVVFLQDVVTW